MSDMPERVRLGRWPRGHIDCVEDSDEDGTDYIRADLYEQAEAARDRLRAHLIETIEAMSEHGLSTTAAELRARLELEALSHD